MTECDRIRADAPGLASLRPDDPERITATSHASGCAECARALREAEQLHSMLAAAEPDLAGDALGRAYTEIREQLHREARRRLLGSIAALCVSAVLLIGFARIRSPSIVDWTLAVVLWVTAVGIAAAASKRPLLATASAVVASVLAGVVSGASGPLAPSLGLECLATELASAAVVVGALWLAIRGGTTSPARSAIAAAAGAGALAGDAALQVTCAAHTAAPHLMAFHVGGVLLAIAGASALWRRRPEQLEAREGVRW
jgi:hypothetical protein